MKNIILNQNQNNNEFNPTISAEEAQCTRQKVLPLKERMTAVRDELKALDANAFEGLKRIVVGEMRQTLGNCIFWYNQWDKNRDYSSVINASMALGKMGSAFNMFCNAVENTPAMNDMAEELNEISNQCWENIRNGVGRIVPFEE